MGLYLLYISANFLLFLKDPGPLNNKKRFSAAKQLSMLPDWIKVLALQKKHDSGWVFAWIFLDNGRNRFRSRIEKFANDFIKKISKTQYTWDIRRRVFLHNTNLYG